jgi:hypothetical protein
MMQDQSQVRTQQVLYWFGPSEKEKPYVQSSFVDIWFLATNSNTLDGVQDIVFIVWRTVLYI